MGVDRGCASPRCRRRRRLARTGTDGIEAAERRDCHALISVGPHVFVPPTVLDRGSPASIWPAPGRVGAEHDRHPHIDGPVVGDAHPAVAGHAVDAHASERRVGSPGADGLAGIEDGCRRSARRSEIADAPAPAPTIHIHVHERTSDRIEGYVVHGREHADERPHVVVPPAVRGHRCARGIAAVVGRVRAEHDRRPRMDGTCGRHRHPAFDRHTGDTGARRHGAGRRKYRRTNHQLERGANRLARPGADEDGVAARREVPSDARIEPDGVVVAAHRAVRHCDEEHRIALGRRGQRQVFGRGDLEHVLRLAREPAGAVGVHARGLDGTACRALDRDVGGGHPNRAYPLGAGRVGDHFRGGGVFRRNGFASTGGEREGERGEEDAMLVHGNRIDCTATALRGAQPGVFIARNLAARRVSGPRPTMPSLAGRRWLTLSERTPAEAPGRTAPLARAFARNRAGAR